MFQADRGKWGRLAHTHTYCHLSVGAALKRWRAVNGKLVLSTYPPPPSTMKLQAVGLGSKCWRRVKGLHVGGVGGVGVEAGVSG